MVNILWKKRREESVRPRIEDLAEVDLLSSSGVSSGLATFFTTVDSSDATDIFDKGDLTVFDDNV